MAPYTFELFAPYNEQAGLRLKNTNARMFVCIFNYSFYQNEHVVSSRVLIFLWN